MTVAAAKPHTDAVVALLTGAGIAVGRGKHPAGSGWHGNPGTSTFKAYAVLYPFPGADERSSLAHIHEDLDFLFQITCVGAVQEQAEALMDQVRATLIGATPSVAGRTSFPIYRVPLERLTSRDDAVAPPLHYSIAQFHFRSEPAT